MSQKTSAFFSSEHALVTSVFREDDTNAYEGLFCFLFFPFLFCSFTARPTFCDKLPADSYCKLSLTGQIQRGVFALISCKCEKRNVPWEGIQRCRAAHKNYVLQSSEAKMRIQNQQWALPTILKQFTEPDSLQFFQQFMWHHMIMLRRHTITTSLITIYCTTVETDTSHVHNECEETIPTTQQARYIIPAATLLFTYCSWLCLLSLIARLSSLTSAADNIYTTPQASKSSSSDESERTILLDGRDRKT